MIWRRGRVACRELEPAARADGAGAEQAQRARVTRPELRLVTLSRVTRSPDALAPT